MNALRTGGKRRREPKSRIREIATPEGLALPLTVATRGARAGALIIDLIILGGATIAMILLLAFTAFGTAIGSATEQQVTGSLEFLFIVGLVLWFLAWNGYFMMFEMGPRGATWGKRLLGIRVAAREGGGSGSGGRLTPEAVVARNLLRDIELFLPLVFLISAPFGDGGAAAWAAAAWFAVFLLFPFLNRDALRAGDLIAGTWVVELPRTKLADALSAGRSDDEPPINAFRFGDEELAVYGEYELQTLENVLRADRPQALEAVAQTIAGKIGWTLGQGDEREFLDAFYAQLRERLESGMKFGNRKADKFAE